MRCTVYRNSHHNHDSLVSERPTRRGCDLNVDGHIVLSNVCAQSFHDDLSGLPNRAAWVNYADDILGLQFGRVSVVGNPVF
jgi:hypothetical protein